MLHIVDIAPYGNEEADLVQDVETITGELAEYSAQAGAELDRLDRWLVVNKIDAVLEKDCDRIVEDLVRKLDWQGPVYRISAIGRIGTQELCNDVMQYLEQQHKAEQPDVLVSIPEQHQ